MLTIDITHNFSSWGFKNFQEGLDAGVEKALDQSAASILNKLRTTYLAEQDPWGSPWVPSGAGQKRRAQGGTGTMFDTGNLFRSIQLHKDGPGVRSISTDVPYGPKQQFGEPPRVFLAITGEHASTAKSIFEYQVQQLLSKS